jgi:hypothetical protein
MRHYGSYTTLAWRDRNSAWQVLKTVSLTGDFADMGRPRDILHNVIKQIDGTFREKKSGSVPASEFRRIRASSLTLRRAKEALGITTQRWRDKNGKWILYWYRGNRNAAKSIQEIEKKAQTQHKHHAVSVAAQYMRDMLTAQGTGYEASAQDIIEALLPVCTRRTMTRAKKELGVVSIKRQNVWYWLWPAQEVQDWLENLLIDTEPLPRERIYDMAQDKGWSRETVNLARQKLGRGEVQELWNDGAWCWYSPKTGAIPQKWRKK